MTNDWERRYGIPRTDEERAARHGDLYGSSELPERGSGLRGTGFQLSNSDSGKLGVILLALGGLWLLLKVRR